MTTSANASKPSAIKASSIQGDYSLRSSCEGCMSVRNEDEKPFSADGNHKGLAAVQSRA